MKRNRKNKNRKAFTLAEAIVVMVIIGIIGVLYNIGIKLYDPTQKGNDVKARKILENIDQTITLILTYNAPNLTLMYLDDANGSFSVADTDTTATAKRLGELFKKYMVIMDREIESKYITSYYSKPLLNYKKVSVGSKLNELYTGFMMGGNGVIYGFKTYASCNAEEKNATPPLSRDSFTVKNICGSVFIDVNAYKGPNKLGSDQFIIPFDVNGTELKKKE